jgi:hypothetical protein
MKKKMRELLFELCEDPLDVDLQQEFLMPSARDAALGQDSNRRAEVVLRELNGLGLICKTQRVPIKYYNETNVIGTLEGESSEQLIVCAHHDRIPQTPGADDNTSGVVTMVGLAHDLADAYGNERPPKTVRMISFGAEESVPYIARRRGYMGSRRYVRYYGTKDVWGVVNIDLVGRERQLSIVERDAMGTGIYDVGLAGLLRGVGYEMGLIISSSYTNVSSSDNRPFAQKDVRTVWLTRLSPRRNKWKVYHTKEDIPETIKLKYLEENKDLLFKTVEYFMEGRGIEK